MAEPVSALAAGPNGWIQNVNFLVFGVLTIAFVVGLHRGVRPSRAGGLGPAILLLSGLALFWAAAFPLREDAAGVTLPPGLHVVSGVMYFSTSAIGLVVVSRRLARDPRWRDLSTYALVAGIVALAGFVAMGTPHRWGGRRADGRPRRPLPGARGRPRDGPRVD